MPAPDSTPDSVTLAALLMVAACDTAMALSMVVAPVTVREPPFSVTAPAPKLPSPATLSVPFDTVVVPVWVCVADKVSVPTPALDRLPAPSMTPERVTAPALLTVPWPPPRVMALSMAVAPVTCSVPPSRVSAPAPRLPSPATLSVPADTVVVPV